MSTEIAPYEGGQPDLYRPQIMTPEAAAELDRQLRMCTKAVLQEGTDYGALPVTDGKKILFKPGAEKLLQWFGLSYSIDRLEVETGDDGRREGVTYRASVVKRLTDGGLMPIAACDGYAGYDEDKFYQSAEAARLKAEAKERHWAAKDGRRPNPAKWMNTTEYRAPWNTVIKMAQKRAIVGAVINATSAGGLFTGDDDSSDAPAGDGPSWYQDALGAALVLTTVEAGRELHRASAQAVLSGDITPKQATHIQNRVAQRVKQLEKHVQVDVTGLTPDVPPAEHAPAPPRPSRGQRSAGGTSKAATEGQVARIDEELERLGYGPGDEEAMLRVTARLARRDPAALMAATDLTADEAAIVITAMQGLDDAAALKALLEDGEVRDE